MGRGSATPEDILYGTMSARGQTDNLAELDLGWLQLDNYFTWHRGFVGTGVWGAHADSLPEEWASYLGNRIHQALPGRGWRPENCLNMANVVIDSITEPTKHWRAVKRAEVTYGQPDLLKVFKRQEVYAEFILEQKRAVEELSDENGEWYMWDTPITPGVYEKRLVYLESQKQLLGWLCPA